MILRKGRNSLAFADKVAAVDCWYDHWQSTTVQRDQRNLGQSCVLPLKRVVDKNFSRLELVWNQLPPAVNSSTSAASHDWKVAAWCRWKIGAQGSNQSQQPYGWAALLGCSLALGSGILLHTELTRMKNDDKLTTLVFAQFCGFGIRFDMKI